GEKVLCFHGPLIYEAKCLKVQNKDKQVKYFIHYAGWNKNWDEWVPESRVLKVNDQNFQRQKDLQKAHEASLNKKNKAKLLGALEKKKSSAPPSKDTGGTSSSGGGDDSRSSTPSTDRSTSSKRSSSNAVSSTTPNNDSEGKNKKTRLDSMVETEEQFMATVEIKIKLPDEMKPVLVDDWDLINRQRKLPILPARVSVDFILQEFIKARTNTKNSTPNRESAVQEVVAGLREYFNVMIGTQLLYKFERPLYADILKDNPDKQMSEIYGFIHLTRLFVRLGQMLAYTQLDEKSITLLNFHLQDFLR
ncbi:UNVERIFIED_CONTAM: hypothetical protein GTU68_019320, partial [Idotea baltica]|nr:hypothetical protein [Idotea baltica]